MSFLLAFLAVTQVGPFVTPGPQPASPLPPEIVERKRRERERSEPPQPALPPTQAAAADEPAERCPGVDNPVDAADQAGQWLAAAAGRDRATAGECLGVAMARLGRWEQAAEAFGTARPAADTPVWRARLGAMAGEAALNAGDAQGALAAFDGARADAAGDTVTTAGIALFRARSLVALKREAEAEAPLAEARRLLPGDPQAWLLSATLSRRLGKLAEAQAQIQKAAELLPIDPAIGLEAGLIAVLSGRDASARKSWQSVITAAPDSDAAATARDYLAQLGAGTAVQATPGR